VNETERADQIRRFVDEVWNGKDYEAAGDLYSEAYANPHGKGPSGKAAGIRANHVSFPDLHVDIDELIVAGDTAVMRFTLNGTDLGGHAGRLPTGRTIKEWAINIMRFENDRVVSEWMGADKLGVFIQLGVFADPWPTSNSSG